MKQEDTNDSEINTSDAQEQISKLGSMLTELRERCGYSIERAAVATRISPPFIQALEKGELVEFPGNVFGRGFIHPTCVRSISKTLSPC